MTLQVDKASVIQPETILDFIDGVTQRRDTPEERVRQEILKSLVREYGYKKEQIEVEFSIKFGSNRKAVDIAIWLPGQAHTQESVFIIVECKDPKTKSRGKKDGVDRCCLMPPLALTSLTACGPTVMSCSPIGSSWTRRASVCTRR